MANRLDSMPIQTVHAVAVSIRSQLNPEITHVANGAAKNSLHAESPSREKWIPKQIMGISKPAIDKAA
jgi:hypothetical protein